MSWDIILFNSKQKIEKIEGLNEAFLEPTDFCSIFDKHFDVIIENHDHREIKGADFAIDYEMDSEPISNKMISLYGENGLYQIIILAKENGWQIFDTSLSQMIDLENPAENGFASFQRYLKLILDKR